MVVTPYAEDVGYITDGLQDLYGRSLSELLRPEIELLCAIGWLETGGGRGWSKAIPGAADSWNMGAITAGASWTGDTFAHRDSYPDANGVNHSYTTKFRRYANAFEGWKDLGRVAYLQRQSVARAACRDEPYAVSAALYDSGYFRGFGATRDDRIAAHHKRLVQCYSAVRKGDALELPEQVPFELRDWDMGAILWELTDEDREAMRAEIKAAVSETPDGTS